jgi:hypothetical protein
MLIMYVSIASPACLVSSPGGKRDQKALYVSSLSVSNVPAPIHALIRTAQWSLVGFHKLE